MSVYHMGVDGLYEALKDGWSYDDMILEEDADLIFTTREEWKAWNIELGAMCGGCEHMATDHQPVGEGWAVCTECAVPSVLPSGWAVGCVWRYGYGACVTDYLKADEQGIDSPDAYRHIPQ